MFKFKFENLLLVVIVLGVVGFGYRYFQRSFTRQKPSVTETSHSATSQEVSPQAQSQSDNTLKPVVLPPKPVLKKAVPGSPQNSKMARYQELLNNPRAGLDRLDLLEKMKGEVSPEELSLRAYYEVFTSGPMKEYSDSENHERRNVVSVAFGMYLDSCPSYEACYQYAVAALARYPDQEIFDDLYLQVQHKYPQDWQRDQIVAEMKKHGITINKKAPK